MSTYTQQNHVAPLTRSNSFFGAIRDIVTAPFSWFGGSEDEFEDAKGKRRRLPAVPEDTDMHDESAPSRTKRQRLGSPVRDTHPYLDPPGSAFAQPRRTSDRSASVVGRDITRSPRKTLRLSSNSNNLPRNRRTVSPLPSGSLLKPLGVTRTMSLDPPSHSSFSSRVQPAPTMEDLQSETNHAAEPMPTSRDVSLSPRHLRVRASLTPQPSGTGFGPVVPPRRERGSDEPPPLASLMSNPMFVKPPPGAQKQPTAEPPQQMTLGTLLDSKRIARTPARQSSILFGTGSMTDVSARHPWPVNKAELALHELEVYKTPLLPTRLKGATAVPDMFMHKEKKHITLMTDDRPDKPRLGTKGKGKEKGKKKERETVNGTKPYAGEGGMKKWLARRKQEEEEAKENERADAMEDEREEEERKRKDAEAEKKKREEELKVPSPPPLAPVFEPRVSREGPSSSSLRVGRTRTGRNHIDRPVSRRTKFSAAYEDEDEDMEESRAAEQKALEEAFKKVPAFELPAGFSFAKETTISHDLVNAKEPPITSLPFSLIKAAAAPQPAPALPVAETTKLIPVPATPAPAPPRIALVPPTPEVVKPVPEAPVPPAKVTPAASAAKTPSEIPNFFGGSSVFGKIAVDATLPSSLAVPPVAQSKVSGVPEFQVPKASDTTSSLFAASSRPISAFTAPTLDSATVSGVPPAIPKEAEKVTAVLPLVTSTFALGAPVKAVEPLPSSTSDVPSGQLAPAEPAKPVASLNNGPFAFGVPAPAPSRVPAAPAKEATPSEAPKSVFTFGQPPSAAAPTTTSAPVTAQPGAETPKSVFGTPPPTTPLSFGQPPGVAAPTEGKPAATSFPFGTPSVVEKKPTTGFTFGTSTTSTAAPATPAVAPAFSFGTAPSGTTAADVSTKPFAFGAAASTRPATPPKAEQEVTMDESPARDMVLNGDAKAPERPTLNFSFSTPSGSALFAQSPATATAPFSFGAPGATVNPFAKEEKKETKPAVSFSSFGQASSTGFSFGQKPPENTSATLPAPAPFQFTQPSPSVAPASPFSFGAPPASAAPFGQPSTGSAPSSPSTFNRPGSFTFGTPTTTQPAATAFGFGAGSQPASPAAGSTSLPTGTTSSTPFTFGAGTSTGATPAAGFGAPTAAAAPGAGSLFTMGSAPPPPDGPGIRRIKALPRRGARR